MSLASEPPLSWLTPDWRWQAIGEISREERATGRRTRPRDPFIRRALRFRALKPDVALDHVQHIDHYDPPLRSLLQALLLGGADDIAIAAETGLSAEEVGLYHGLFFDVRDRPAGWIEAKVLTLPAYSKPDDIGQRQVVEAGSTHHDHWPRLGWMLGAPLFQALLHGTVSQPDDMARLAQAARLLGAHQHLRQLITKPARAVEMLAKAKAKEPQPSAKRSAQTWKSLINQSDRVHTMEAAV